MWSLTMECRASDSVAGVLKKDLGLRRRDGFSMGGGS